MGAAASNPSRPAGGIVPGPGNHATTQHSRGEETMTHLRQGPGSLTPKCGTRNTNMVPEAVSPKVFRLRMGQGGTC
jgi:transposase